MVLTSPVIDVKETLGASSPRVTTAGSMRGLVDSAIAGKSSSASVNSKLKVAVAFSKFDSVAWKVSLSPSLPLAQDDKSAREVKINEGTKGLNLSRL